MSWDLSSLVGGTDSCVNRNVGPCRAGLNRGWAPGEATAPRRVGLQVPGSHGRFYSAPEMVPNYPSVRPLLSFVPGRPPELFTLG